MPNPVSGSGIPGLNVAIPPAITGSITSALGYSSAGGLNFNSLAQAFSSNYLQPGTQLFGIPLSGSVAAQFSSLTGGTPGQRDSNSGWASVFGDITSSMDLGPFQSLLQSSSSSLFGGPTLFPASRNPGPGLQYPGAGDEPEAQYGGFVYNTKAPVVFSITKAQSQAKTDGMWDMMAAKGPTLNWNEISSLNLDSLGTNYNPNDFSFLPSDMNGSVANFATVATAKVGSSNVPGLKTTGNWYSKYGGKIDVSVLDNLGSSVSDLTFLPEKEVIDLGKNFRAPSNSFFRDDLSNLYKSTSGMKNFFTEKNLSDMSSYLDTAPSPGTWKFIMSPDQISWQTASSPQRIEMFGTNAPPVIHGAKSMRDLSLSKAVVEGFTRSKQVEAKVAELESLMNYELSNGNPFVNVPVYHVTANEKKYGDGFNGIDGGYFVIKGINVEETIRDFTGRSTRAIVDVEFMQVPAYQVESGIDQASKSVAGAKSLNSEIGDKYEAVAKEQEAKRQAEAVNKNRKPKPTGNAAYTKNTKNGRVSWKDPRTGRTVGKPFPNTAEGQAEALKLVDEINAGKYPWGGG
jgi:hypothetical protein